MRVLVVSEGKHELGKKEGGGRESLAHWKPFSGSSLRITPLSLLSVIGCRIMPYTLGMARDLGISSEPSDG